MELPTTFTYGQVEKEEPTKEPEKEWSVKEKERKAEVSSRAREECV